MTETLLHTHLMNDAHAAKATLDAGKALFRARRRIVPELLSMGPERLADGEARQADIRLDLLTDGPAWELLEARLGRPVQEGDTLLAYSVTIDGLTCAYAWKAGLSCLR